MYTSKVKTDCGDDRLTVWHIKKVWLTYTDWRVPSHFVTDWREFDRVSINLPSLVLFGASRQVVSVLGSDCEPVLRDEQTWNLVNFYAHATIRKPLISLGPKYAARVTAKTNDATTRFNLRHSLQSSMTSLQSLWVRQSLCSRRPGSKNSQYGSSQYSR